MKILGIDPGLRGGIATLDEYLAGGGTWLPAVCPMPSLNGAKDYYPEEIARRFAGADLAYIERQAPRPNTSCQAVFKNGFGYGGLIFLLRSMHVETVEVTPQAWKLAMGVSADKRSSIKACNALFPAVDLVPKGCKTPHDGMAEALLIAEYGRCQLSR